MPYELGSIVVHKATGEYAVVIGISHKGYAVRMAKGQPAGGVEYVQYEFIPEELETPEQHLRKELAEMELRQTLLGEARKRLNMKELEAEKKDIKDLVN